MIEEVEESDRRQVIRSMIQHEDTLRDQRLGWLLTLNGFLFAALAFAWRYAYGLAIVVALFGMAIAFTSGTTLKVNDLAIKRLRDLEPGDDPAPVMAITSDQIKASAECKNRLQRWYINRLPSWYTWNLIPVFLVTVWLVILLLRIST